MPSKIATAEEWREARLRLLAKEKEQTLLTEAIAAERQALPMVLLTKIYTFKSHTGLVTLKDLFGTKTQLIIYHYMFEPNAIAGCTGCAFMAANFPSLKHLAQKDTAFAAVSRAPIEKITTFRDENFWTFPWVSSLESDFNYDFHVTLDAAIAPLEYNFERKKSGRGEQPGLSVFKLQDGKIYHTYSSYNRLDNLAATYTFLDLTPAGRQEGDEGPAEFKLPSEYAKEAIGAE